MSLTSFLKAPISKDFRNKLKNDFPRPKFSLKADMIALPQSKNYSIIGTAFNYLLRFKLEQTYMPKGVQKKQWLVERKINDLSDLKPFEEMQMEELRKLYDFPLPEDVLKCKLEIKNSMRKERWDKQKSFYDKSSNLFEEAKADYKRYLQTGKFTKSLAKSSIVLAKLDLVGRAGIYDETINVHVKEDIQDLENLFKAIPIEDFKPSKSIILNPTFGEGSSIFLGADADLIIDHTLIEIKTTMKLAITRSHINQLLCYTFASRIGGINGDEKLKDEIKSIGVYFSRYSLLYTIPLSDFGSAKQLQAFTKWIPDFFDEKFS